MYLGQEANSSGQGTQSTQKACSVTVLRSDSMQDMWAKVRGSMGEQESIFLSCASSKSFFFLSKRSPHSRGNITLKYQTALIFQQNSLPGA
jgi:hypothetical protein